MICLIRMISDSLEHPWWPFLPIPPPSSLICTLPSILQTCSPFTSSLLSVKLSHWSFSQWSCYSNLRFGTFQFTDSSYSIGRLNIIWRHWKRLNCPQETTKDIPLLRNYSNFGFCTVPKTSLSRLRSIRCVFRLRSSLTWKFRSHPKWLTYYSYLLDVLMQPRNDMLCSAHFLLMIELLFPKVLHCGHHSHWMSMELREKWQRFSMIFCFLFHS